MPTSGRSPAGGAVVRAEYAYTPEGEGPDEAVRSLSSTIRNFLRFKWLILGIFVLISGATLPAIWMFVKPEYRARAKVKVAPTNPRLVYNTDEEGGLRTYPVFLNTQIATILSPVVIERALSRPEVQQTEWYNETPKSLKTMLGGAPPSRLERLQDTMKVENIRATELIEVSLETKNPNDPQKIVNAVVEEYIKYDKEATDELEDQLFEALRKERAELEMAIKELVEQKASLSKQLGTDDPDIVRAQIATQLGDLEMKRKEVWRDHEQTLFALERSRNGGGAETETTEPEPAGMSQYAADPEWSRLNRALQDANHKLAIGRQNLGALNPRLRELEADVTYAKQMLAEREQQLGPGWQPTATRGESSDAASLLTMSVGMLDAKAAVQARELELLDEQIKSLREEQEQKGELAKRVAQVTDQLERKKALATAVLDRLQALELEQKAPARIGIASLAVAPSSSSSDKRLMLSVLALGAALVCGLTVAHLLGSINPKLLVADDVEDSVHVPFLGQLPAVTSTTSPLVNADPILAECMRIIRTALLERIAGTDRRAVMVTSASSRAGKTSVSIQLAHSLAQMGKKTLLVEADLRRPTVAGRIGLDAEIGLGHLLCGLADDDEAIIRSVRPGLDVVVAGKLPDSFSPERFTNGAFAGCLARWKGQYDIVLIDTPPVLPVADSRIMATQTDGAVLVSRSAHCRRTDVIQACADLNAVGGELLGTILVGTRGGSRYGYGTGYEAYVNAYRVLES